MQAAIAVLGTVLSVRELLTWRRKRIRSSQGDADDRNTGQRGMFRTFLIAARMPN
jgi:hypothetical protein